MDKAMSREQALKWIEAACNADTTTRHAFSTIRRELMAMRKIIDLCKEEIEHGFDLPSDVFDLVEAYWGIFRAPQSCPCDEQAKQECEHRYTHIPYASGRSCAKCGKIEKSNQERCDCDSSMMGYKCVHSHQEGSDGKE